jgi:hypothetical protein
MQAARSRIERKTTYLPMGVTTIGPVQLDTEDWSTVKAKDGTIYDPSQRAECGVLESILRAGLLAAVFSDLYEPVPPNLQSS